MPSFIVKVEPDRDLYVVWSTVVEAPLTWGTRAEMMAAQVREHAMSYEDIVARFQRADA